MFQIVKVVKHDTVEFVLRKRVRIAGTVASVVSYHVRLRNCMAQQIYD